MSRTPCCSRSDIAGVSESLCTQCSSWQLHVLARAAGRGGGPASPIVLRGVVAAWANKNHYFHCKKQWHSSRVPVWTVSNYFNRKIVGFTTFFTGRVWTRSCFSMCQITRCALAFSYGCCPISRGVIKPLKYPTNAPREHSAIIIIMFVLDEEF